MPICLVLQPGGNLLTFLGIMSEAEGDGSARVAGTSGSRLYFEATAFLSLAMKSVFGLPSISKTTQTLPLLSSESTLGKTALYPPCTRARVLWATSSKKTLKASEQEREDTAKSRKERQEFQAKADARRLIFLDESGLKTNMARLYGRSYQGTRCLDSAPCGRWETVTILSSVRLDGTTESLVFEGAVVRKMFDAYVKDILAPPLRPGDIVIMDNLNAHKSLSARAEIENRHGQMLFLPAYSPDFNPIEKMWSKIKQILRGLKPRTQLELMSATATALDAVTKDDAQGWFGSCGDVLFQS